MAITDLIFRPEDRPILTYLEDDGISVEPEFYVPIIPMILVNGTLGIGTGFSTNIPSFNPLEIIRALKAGNMAAFDGMKPYFRGFKGAIKSYVARSKADEEASARFSSHGKWRRTDKRTIVVDELPIGVWTEDFKALLEDRLVSDKGIISKYDVQYKDPAFEFSITYASEAILDEMVAVDGKIDEDLKLVSTRGLSTSNMYLFNEASQITKYASIREIVDEFVRTRIKYYGKRRAYILKQLKEENRILTAKSRFIEDVVARRLEVGGRKMDAIIESMTAMKYEKVEDSYDYLLRLPISSLTMERKLKLDEEIKLNEKSIKYYTNTSDRELWTKELGELEEVLAKSGMYK
jgi:DNA topoisomerase-2